MQILDGEGVLTVFTIQLAQWRLIKDTDIKLVDITLKSGNKAFAPTPDLLYLYKKGLITKEEYTDVFLTLMKKSKEDNREEWLKLLGEEKIALTCYCGANDFCHRHSVAKELQELATELNMLVILKGEITKETVSKLI